MTATCSVTKHKHRSRKSTNVKYASCKEKLFFSFLYVETYIFDRTIGWMLLT